MKKFLLSVWTFLLTALLAFGFAACDGGESGNVSGSDGDSGSSETAAQYTVTYNANGGAFEDEKTTLTATVDANGTLTAPESPKRANYTFDGWATTALGIDKWNFATDKVTKDVTLYAVWAQQSAAILSVDGASIEEQEIFMFVDKDTDSVSLASKVVCSDDSVWKLYYDKLGQMEIPTKIAASASGELLNGDNVFYMVVTSKDGLQTNLYEINVYRSYAVGVNYYDEETLLKTETVYTGYEYTTNYEPEITGYTFNGWGYTTRVLWDTLNLYADKTAHTYTVTCNVNGGDELTTTEKTVTYDSDYTLEKPIRTGYTFLGWYDGEMQMTDEKGNSLAVWKGAEDLTVTAKWELTAMLKFEYTSHKGNYYITGIKDKTVTNIFVPDCVVSIAESAFSGCGNVTSITLPFVGGSVKSANDTYQYPFGYIFGKTGYTGGVATTQYYYGSSTSDTTNSTYYIPRNLKMVTITSGNILRGAFQGCSSLTSIEIPDNVTSIGEYVFYGCSSLTSITIPDSVTSIGGYAFSYCSGLKSVCITDIEAWCNISFAYSSANPLNNGANLYLNNELVTEIEIPNTITEIKACAFSGCSSLTSVVIPDSVTSIGGGAFQGCSSLTSIEIPDNVTSIGGGAFSNCDSLTSIEIPDGVTSIGGGAFSNCDSLTSIEIPDGVTSIGGSAFQGCSSLTSIEIPGGVTSIGDYAFSGCYNLVEVVNKSPHITIKKGSTSNGLVGYYALAVYNSGDTFVSKLSNDNGYVVYTDGTEKILVGYTGTEVDLTLPSYITKIYQYAFSNCESLTSVTIGDSVTSIDGGAFLYRYSLTSVTIGNGVTSIGDSAFANCVSLTSITFNGTKAQWNAISKGSGWKFNVPATKVVCSDGEVTL